MGNSEQLSYTITIVDTHICTFFDGVLEEMLESKIENIIKESYAAGIMDEASNANENGDISL